MPRYDFRSPRLFVEASLAPRQAVVLDRFHANYLVNVLRLRPGDAVLVFNGRDGEWRAMLTGGGKRPSLVLEMQTRPQPPDTDLHFLFAPLKHARLDYMVQKAVEMGASRLQPVLTRYSQIGRINLKRMRANAIEAAEQCGILAIPEIGEPIPFSALMTKLGHDRTVVFCDEDADVHDPITALSRARPADRRTIPLAVLVGPEGGFAPDERESLLTVSHIIRLSLGPRILRADTAAVAALALVNSVLGDWH